MQPTSSRTAAVRHRTARRAVEELLIVMRGQSHDRRQRNTGSSRLNQDINETRCKSVSTGAARTTDSKLFAERISGESREKIRRNTEIKPCGDVNTETLAGSAPFDFLRNSCHNRGVSLYGTAVQPASVMRTLCKTLGEWEIDSTSRAVAVPRMTGSL